MDRLDSEKHYHFIGIGGIGMSALAKLLLQQKIAVSGSDMKEGPATDALEKKGAAVHIGHSSELIQEGMAVIYSSGIPQGNAEYQRALELKCPILHRQELLSLLTKGEQLIAVAGTHGKTTTSALLASALTECGIDPSFMVGGILTQYQTNARRGAGKVFVCEVDESDGSFQRNHPYGAIVTNIDLDHMNHYGTEEQLLKSFQKFLDQVESPDHLFWCCDDERLSSLQPSGISYGFSDTAMLRITDVETRGWNSDFSICFEGEVYRDIPLPLTGTHHLLNGAAVFGMALKLGAAPDRIREAFEAFDGVKRRSEKVGKAKTIEIIDDYAHHPTAVKATLESVRQSVEERRIVAVFQPHRYSRLPSFLEGFPDTFEEADHVVITDLYCAGETPSMGIPFETFIASVKAVRPDAVHVGRGSLLPYLEKFAMPHDLVIFLGAGDITNSSKDFYRNLSELPEKKLKVSVICGGGNHEHAISLMSAEFVERSLSSERYEVTVFEIDRQRRWSQRGRASEKSAFKACLEGDVMFPIIHGPGGEDGTIQGLFTIFRKPCVGMDFLAAGISMDKALTKKLVQLAGVKTAPFVEVDQRVWKTEKSAVLKMVKDRLSFPVIVKGVHQGSSIGLIQAASIEELPQAVDNAFHYDNRLVIENRLHGREIEFAVLGNAFITVFPPGEILTQGEIYDYEKKYGESPFSTTISPELPREAVEKGCKLAEQAFLAVGGQGMARVDFFYDDAGVFWLNEINPVPGMTKISLYPKLCEKHGISAEELMDRLIVLALHKQRKNPVYG